MFSWNKLSSVCAERLFVLAVLLVGVALSPAQAETRPSNPPLSLHYMLYAGGLKVVAVGVNYTLGAKDYDLHATANTRGIWSSLVPWSNIITARGGVDESGVHPRIARYDTIWREKPKTIEMAFAPTGEVSVVSNPPQKPDGRVEATPEQLKGTMDPLSAVADVLARGLDKGCSGKIPAFDGRRIYNLVLTNKGEEMLKANDYSMFSGMAIHCEVTFEPVAGFPIKEKRAGFWNAKDNADKRNPLIIWMAKVRADWPVLPVRVQSTVQLGTLVAHLQAADVVQ